jgi:formate dehydrogenase iron-sulfur subunit
MTRLYLPQDAAALALGADQVLHVLQSEAARRGLTLEIIRTGTRGAVWLEPLLEVETPSGRIGYGPVQPADVAALLDAGLLNGADHALCIGSPEAHPWFAGQTRLTFARCGLIDPLSVEAYREHGGYDGLARALELGPVGTIDEVKRSGLRGRGGAGFPTGIKWNTVMLAQADRKYVVCNADEGDSGTFADRILMEGDPLCLVEGMTIAGVAVGATYGYIYIRSEYPHAIRTMNGAIDAARRAGLLGADILGSGCAFDLEVRVGAGAYICGEETSLLDSLEGKRGQGTRTERPFRAVQIGGPLGAYFPAALLDTPMDYEAFARAGGLLGHGGVVVFDDSVNLAVQARFAFEFCAIESCGKCTPCRIGAVRGMEVVDRITAGIDTEKNFALLDDLCELMTDASLCAMGGLTPVPVVSALKHFPDDFDRVALPLAAE